MGYEKNAEKFLKNKEYDKAIEEALMLSEPKKTKILLKIIKTLVYDGKPELAIEKARLFGHELTETELYNIVANQVWPN